jgi:hypothetical protein
MLDRPDAAELLEALAAFLDHAVVPSFEGGQRFHALVAASVARIVARELRLGDRLVDEEVDDLRDLLSTKNTDASRASKEQLFELTRDLCARIETGAMDDEPARSRFMAYVKRSISRRLEVDNPKYPR